MTDTQKLLGKMKEKGFTIKKLALRLGLSYTGLFNKIHNKTEFLLSEIQAIIVILSLNKSELLSIFFAKVVELNST